MVVRKGGWMWKWCTRSHRQERLVDLVDVPVKHLHRATPCQLWRRAGVQNVSERFKSHAAPRS